MHDDSYPFHALWDGGRSNGEEFDGSLRLLVQSVAKIDTVVIVGYDQGLDGRVRLHQGNVGQVCVSCHDVLLYEITKQINIGLELLPQLVSLFACHGHVGAINGHQGMQGQ
jgi:hypothetical protein